MGQNRPSNYTDRGKKFTRAQKPLRSEDARKNWNEHNAKKEGDKVDV